MNPIAHQPLPLATLSALTPVGAMQPAPAQAWQRHLVRAGLPQAPASPAPQLAPPQQQATPPALWTPTVAMPVSCAASTPVSRAGSMPVGATGHSLPAPNAAVTSPTAVQQGQAPAQSSALPPELEPPRDPPLADAEEVPRNAPPRGTQERGQTAVRVHVESHADGIAVWLGVNGDAATVSARAAAVLSELQRNLAGQTSRLALVVCNGTTVYRSCGSIEEKR